MLRPVPNLGGEQAIATEARRLRDLAARGLRVPTVLAQQPGGLLLAHLGRPDQPTPSLGNEIESALPKGPEVVLALWLEGLQALSYVHATGTSLSQAFARNLVRCPDGTVGYIDFEDDPVAVLPLAHCQARDALCYVHSTALFLVQAGAGWLVPQRELSSQKLAEMLQNTERPALLERALKAKNMQKIHATDAVVTACEELAA